MFHFAAALGLTVALGGGSCQLREEPDGYTDGLLDGIPVPADLAPALARSRDDRRPGGPLTADHEWRAELDLRLDSNETHATAAAEFFTRWRQQPGRLLWLECVAHESLWSTEPDSVAAVRRLLPPGSPAARFLAAILDQRSSTRDSLLEGLTRADFPAEEDRLVLRRLRALYLRSVDGVGNLIDALPAARGIGGPFFEGRLWRTLGDVLAREGHLEAAMHAEVRSMELYQQSPGRHWAFWAGIQVAQQLMAAQRPGRALLVLDRTRARARTADAIFAEVSAIGVATSLYVDFGEIRRALDLDLEAFRLMHRFSVPDERPLMMLNIADDYVQLAELDSARAWIDSAHVDARAVGQPDILWAVYLDDADLSALEGRAARADSLGALTDSISQGLPWNRTEGDAERRLLHRAKRALQLGDFPVAEASVERLRRRLSRRIPQGLGEDFVVERHLLSAQLDSEAGNRVSAWAQLDSCTRWLHEHPSPSRSARVLALEGRIALEGGDPVLGLEFIHAATDSALSSGRPALALRQRLLLAQALLAADSVDAARAELQRVGALLSERAGLRMLQERDYWLSRCDEVEGKPRDALARARALLAQGIRLPQDLRVKTLLSAGRLEEGHGSRKAAREAYESVLRETGDARRRLETPTWRYTARDARREAVDGLVRLELYPGETPRSARASLRWVPLLREGSGAKPPDPLRLPALPTLALLLDEPESTAWFIRADTVEVRRLPGRQKLERLAQRVLDGVASPGRPRDEAAETELGELLIRPFVPHWPEGSLLQVLADGAFRALPWDLLRLGDVTCLDRGPVVQVPALQPSRGSRPSTLADLPVAAFGRNDAAGAGRPTLVNAEANATAMAAAGPRGSDAWCGPRASVEAVIAGGKRGCFLYIVLHSIGGRFTPGQTALALEHGQLDAQRIAGESLACPLVLLESCETVDRRGRGLDLPRAFIEAGAGCVIASPIKVPDLPCERFTLIFHRHLRAGLSPEEALRRTKLESGAGPEERTDPTVWAPWQVIRTAR